MNPSIITNPITFYSIVTVLCGVVALLFKMYVAVQDKRLEDQKENNALYQKAMGEFSDTSKLLLAKLNGREQ